MRRSGANEVVVDVGPVDLRVLVPAQTADRLRPGVVTELHTHFVIHGDQRSSQVSLYGFESEVALELFEHLIRVSGVGPRAALGLLSVLDADEARRAIIAGDQRTLARAPGIGPRVASRIVSELQAKLAEMEPMVENGDAQYGTALTALVGLGYSVVDVRQALEAGPPSAPMEELIRSALEFLDRR
ncbi:MAG: Holliday junction branch migration protein RuvA [Chloroflexi bacterium]|nr:Holliday junction branch migration protein RuvA [Chloroflexota bacterium]